MRKPEHTSAEPSSEVVAKCQQGALRVRDACEFAACGRTELYRAISRGELITVKHGRRTAILKHSLVRWIAQRTRST